MTGFILALLCGHCFRHYLVPKSLQNSVSKRGTGEAQFERHRFLTGFLGPKNGPEDFAGEPNFLCRVCDTGKPDGACREAESIQKSSPRCQQSGFNKTTGEWEECYF